MYTKTRRILTAVFSVLLIAYLAVPGISFAAPSPEASQLSRADQTYTVTLEYYENLTHVDPDDPTSTPTEPDGRRLMGTRVLTDLSYGQELNTWDYVVDIPGYFFFDAWPGTLQVGNPNDGNVIQLFYFRQWNTEYTVNYYLMTGADLTSDTWIGALAPDDVQFYKMGSEVFTDQPFDKVVNGDAYEYLLDGTYVIDTYPAQIRLGTDADNNVINVLYTPASTTLPDNFEIPDDIFIPETTPPSESGPDASTPNPVLPDDDSFEYDEIIDLIPNDALLTGDANQSSTTSELRKDFIGSGAETGNLIITNEMLEHPVSKEEALATANAYLTGLLQGCDMLHVKDIIKLLAVISIGILAIIVILISLSMYYRKRMQVAEAFNDQSLKHQR